MASRLTRWGVASVLAFAGLLATTLPPGPSVLEPIPHYREEPGEAPLDRAWRSTVDALDMTRWRLREAEDRAALLRLERPRRSPLVVRLDRGMVQVDEEMTRRAEEYWREAQIPEGATSVLLVAGNSNGSNGLGAFATVPGVCTVHLAQAYGSGWRRDPIASSAGRCLLESRFGPPSRSVRAWLDSLQHIALPGRAPASPLIPPGLSGQDQWPEWLVGGTSGRRSWDGWIGSRELLACAAGRIEFCQAALRLPTWTTGLPWLRYSDRRLPALLPAALLAELGPERFGELWRSDSPIPESFERLTGTPFDPWAMQFVQRRIGRVERPTALGLGGWIGWVFWVGLLTGWTIVRLRGARAR